MKPSRRTNPKKSDVGQLRGQLNDLIVQRMSSQGIDSVKEFADKHGIGRSTLYDLVRGRSDGTISNPSLETISRLAEALDRPAHEILYLVNPDAPGAAATISALQVPVYMAGQAGAGPQQLHELEQQIFVEADFARGRDLVAFKVNGNSMAGGKRPIYDGDVVIVDRNIAPEINMPVVARLTGDGYVVKRLRPRNILDSTNPDFNGPHALIAPDEIAQVVGKVVRVLGNLA